MGCLYLGFIGTAALDPAEQNQADDEKGCNGQDGRTLALEG